MQNAIECAAGNEIAAGILWLDIARELRIGETARPLPRPLDVAGITPDRMADYWRGQAEPPSPTAVDFARHRQSSGGLATTEEWSLMREILERAGEADRLMVIPDEHELRVGERPAPWEAPQERPEDTAVIRYAEGGPVSGPPRCGNCGHTIELFLPDGNGGVEGWHHSITMQAVCPVSQSDQQHTFATPVVDARG